jgi:hypothetical protein
MGEKRQHIISKLKWLTSFDLKSIAGQCQSRISSWSHHHLPGELTGVLDHFSLPGQTMQIDKLELDIGPVSYLNFEQEVAGRIKDLLRTKLSELLRQQKEKSGNSALQIRDEVSSDLQILKAFLLHGTMPWNHSRADQTINELIGDLLINDSKALVQMITHIARNKKRVSQRIAWQVSEPHIISIIRILEPANTNLITGFVKDMVVKQEKETIVQGTSKEFKTNLWCWVLDYLFTNHGSVFNKKQFLKRSLQQLSAHYNIHYDELLSTIKILVQQYGHSDTTDNFVELLSSIADEQKVADHLPPDDFINDHERLAGYFLHYKDALSPGAKADFNQLVNTLSKDQPAIFTRLIHSLTDNPALWQHAIAHLENEPLELIAQAQHSEMAGTLLGHVQVLLSVSSTALPFTRHQLWTVSMRYMARKKNIVFDKDDLLRHLITELSLNNSLLVATVPVEHKIPALADRYSELKDALLLHAEKERSLEKQIYQFIWGLSSAGDTTARKAAACQLIHFIMRCPGELIRLFENYPDKQQLRTALHSILDYAGAKQLLRQISNDKAGPVSLLNKELDTFAGDILISELIKEVTIETIVNKDQGSTELSNIIAAFADDKDMSAEIKEKFISAFPPGEIQNTSKVDDIIALINDGKNDKRTIGRLLSSFLKQTTPAGLQAVNTTHREIIFDLLIPGSSQLCKEIISRYGSAEVKKQLEGICWHLLADYRSHQGKINLLENLLDKAISVALTVRPGDKIAGVHATGKDVMFALADKKLIDQLLHSLIIDKKIPAWLKLSSHRRYNKELVNEVITHYHQEFVSFLRKDILSVTQVEWLGEVLAIKTLTSIAARSHPRAQSAYNLVESFYHFLSDKNWVGVPGKQLQIILSKMIMEMYIHNNMHMLTAQNGWNDLLWEIITRHHISSKQLLDAIDKDKSSLPSPLLTAFEKIKKQDKKDDRRSSLTSAKKPFLYSKIQFQPQQDHPAREGVVIHNAGLVLINSYLLLLFDRLGLTAGNQFIDEAAKQQAVHYLQYIVTGKEFTDESFLPLNKLLCGIDLSTPVPGEIIVSAGSKELIEGLINALIGHWPAIGHTSIDGFRGNWLVRKGVLTELDEKWELNVEKRTYDLLLGKSPFSFSVIKFPWMRKPLHINWPY